MYKSLLRIASLQATSIRKSGGKRNNKRPGGAKEAMQAYDFNRRWKLVDERSRRKPPPSSSSSFKLVSYNILAQDLLLEHLYLYMGIQQEWLTWRRRQQNLQRELIKLDPDILCLQEMQYDHLAQLVQGLRMSNGRRLEYVYKKKTGHRTDGCAIIYDPAMFQLLDQRAVELYDHKVALLNRENVALFAKFRLKKDKDPCKDFVVATTHLLYNPRRSDVRCAQVGRIMEELRIFSEDSPVVLTGDFNSLPTSDPMALLTGKPEDEKEEKDEKKEKPSELDTATTPTLRFEILDPGDETASTHQDGWITVDYILRSLSSRTKHKLLPVCVYSLPTIHCCSIVGAIPNHYLGSDHYAMGAVFAVV